MRRANSDNSFFSRVVGDFKRDFISGAEDLNNKVDTLGNKLETFTKRVRSSTDSFDQKLDNLTRKFDKTLQRQLDQRVDRFEEKVEHTWNKVRKSSKNIPTDEMGSKSSKPSRPKISAPLGPATLKHPGDPSRNPPHYSRPPPPPPVLKTTRARRPIPPCPGPPPNRPLPALPTQARLGEVKNGRGIKVDQRRIQSQAGSIMSGTQRAPHYGKVSYGKAEQGRIGRVQSQKAVISHPSTVYSSSIYSSRPGSQQTISPPVPLKDAKYVPGKTIPQPLGRANLDDRSPGVCGLCGKNSAGKGSACKECAAKVRAEHLAKVDPWGGKVKKCVYCFETPEIPGRGYCQECGEKKGRSKVQTLKRQCGHCWNVRELNIKGLCEDCAKKNEKKTGLSRSRPTQYSARPTTHDRLSRPPDLPASSSEPPVLERNDHAGPSSNLGGLSGPLDLPDMPAFWRDSVVSKDWSNFSQVSAVPAPLNIKKQPSKRDERRTRANTTDNLRPHPPSRPLGPPRPPPEPPRSEHPAFRASRTRSQAAKDANAFWGTLEKSYSDKERHRQRDASPMEALKNDPERMKKMVKKLKDQKDEEEKQVAWRKLLSLSKK